MAFLLVASMASGLFARFAPVLTLWLRLSVAAAAVGPASTVGMEVSPGTTVPALRPVSAAWQLS
jgi:hypothetical protein